MMRRNLGWTLLACIVLVGVVPLARAESTPKGKPKAKLTAAGVDVSQLTRADEGRFLSYIKQNGKTPVDYVVSKFADHDIVIMGEAHGNRDILEFIAELIPVAYRQAGVRCLATEFLKSRNNKRANRIVTAPAYDGAAVMDLYRDFHSLWGYKEYMDIFKAVWHLNNSLPADAEKFRIVGLDMAEDVMAFERRVKEKGANPAERDNLMAETFIREIGQSGAKALLHTGLHHAFTRYRLPAIESGGAIGQFPPRLGCLLAQTYGEKVFQIRFHQWGYAAAKGKIGIGGPRQILGGLMERVMKANRNGPVGFDVDGSPFQKLRDKKSFYYAYQPQVVFSDLNAGYVFLKPVKDTRKCRWATGFINQTNYDKAYKFAIARKWVKPGQYKTPKELDRRFKTLFESR